MFRTGSVREVLTSRKDVIAFKVEGHVSRGSALSLIEHVNELFQGMDGNVNILMDLSRFEGSVLTTFFDGDATEKQIQSHDRIDRYAIIGAPEDAQFMVSWIAKVVPLNAQTFTTEDAERAWLFVGADPVSEIDLDRLD